MSDSNSKRRPRAESSRLALATYLHDHLSGAVGALELLDSLEKVYRGRPLGKFLAALQTEIRGEREHLETLCALFPLSTKAPRKLAAWIAEKGLEAKLSFDGGGEDDFRLFESLEILSVGIAGKRLLWRTLSREAKSNSAVPHLPYARLIEMAIRQRKEVEVFRLRAAEKAFVNLGVAD